MPNRSLPKAPRKRSPATHESSDALAVIAEIAALVARGASLAALVPRVLDALARGVRSSDCELWLRDGVGEGAPAPRRAGTAGGAPIDALDAARCFDGAALPADLTGAVRPTGERGACALLVRRDGRLADDEQTLIEAVADLLVTPLRAADYARRLEMEVVERTMEFEEQRRFTAKIIDSLPVGLYVIDRQYRIQAWNRKRETGMQGVSREEALGRTIFEILHRQPEALLRREFEDVFATGRIQQFQIESTATGDKRTYRITKIPMRLDDTGISHVITIGEDVTEWRDAQDRIAQAEKLAAIGTLAAGVMHEINNPLATIGACAESVAFRVAERGVGDAALPAALDEALRVIEHEVHRCKHIVNGVLDFSRPKSATRDLVDLNALVEKTLFLLKHHARMKKLTVTVDAARPIAPVLANEEQLIQVLMALLLNAVDAMHERGTIRVETRLDDVHRAVTLAVIDTGDGIRRSELPKLFEPFYTTKPPGRGTGLGLSICYSLVAEHGGRIEVESEVGKGSVFRVVLPLAADLSPEMFRDTA